MTKPLKTKKIRILRETYCKKIFSQIINKEGGQNVDYLYWDFILHSGQMPLST